MDKVERIFLRLKAEGKIKIAKDIVINNSVSNFKAGRSKKIEYNERMNELSEESIEFGLLHEEGHFRGPCERDFIFYWLIPIILIIIVVVVLFVKLFIKTFTSLMLLSVGILILSLSTIIFITRIWVKRIYQKYEYLADEFAADYFQNPSEIIASFFRELDGLKKKETKKVKTWEKVIKIVLGLDHAHPTHEQRIKNLKEKFQTE